MDAGAASQKVLGKRQDSTGCQGRRVSSCGQQPARIGTAGLEAKLQRVCEACSHTWALSAIFPLSTDDLQAGKDVDENTEDGKGQPTLKEIAFHSTPAVAKHVCLLFSSYWNLQPFPKHCM